MENFTSSYGITSKYLRKNDPIYPCNAVAQRHKLYCYLLVTSNALRINGYDLKKTAAACKRSEAAWVSTCYESFGRDVSGLAGNDATKALANCRLATTHESECLYGVSRDITSSDAGGARAGRFCARAPARHQAHCYEGVGSVLGSIETTRRGAARALPRGRRPPRPRLPARRGPRAGADVVGRPGPARPAQ